jgi:hypothetical protein
MNAENEFSDSDESKYSEDSVKENNLQMVLTEIKREINPETDNSDLMAKVDPQFLSDINNSIPNLKSQLLRTRVQDSLVKYNSNQDYSVTAILEKISNVIEVSSITNSEYKALLIDVLGSLQAHIEQEYKIEQDTESIKDMSELQINLIKSEREMLYKIAIKMEEMTSQINLLSEQVATQGEATRNIVIEEGEATRETVHTEGQATRETVHTEGQATRETMNTIGNDARSLAKQHFERITAGISEGFSDMRGRFQDVTNVIKTEFANLKENLNKRGFFSDAPCSPIYGQGWYIWFVSILWCIKKLFDAIGDLIKSIYFVIKYVQAFWRDNIVESLVGWIPDLFGLPIKNIARWFNFLFEVACLVGFVDVIGGYFGFTQIGTTYFQYFVDTLTWFIPKTLDIIYKIVSHILHKIGSMTGSLYQKLKITKFILGLVDCLKAIFFYSMDCIYVYFYNKIYYEIPYPIWPDLYNVIQARLISGGDKPHSDTTIFAPTLSKIDTLLKTTKPDEPKSREQEKPNSTEEDMDDIQFLKKSFEGIEDIFKDDSIVKEFNEISEKYLGDLEKITAKNYKYLHSAILCTNVLLNVSKNGKMDNKEKEEMTRKILGDELVNTLKNKYEEMLKKKSKKGGKSRRRYKKLRNITKRRPKKYLRSRISKRIKKMYKNHKKSYKPLK